MKLALQFIDFLFINCQLKTASILRYSYFTIICRKSKFGDLVDFGYSQCSCHPNSIFIDQPKLQKTKTRENMELMQMDKKSYK